MRPVEKFLLFCLLGLTGCTTAPTLVVTTNTPPPQPVTVTPQPTDPTLTPLPAITVTPVPTALLPTSALAFPVGPGGADVIPHQIVRAASDHLYIFSATQSSNLLRVYHTLQPGFPSSAADFAPVIEFTAPAEIISVDAVYDGIETIHALINTQSGAIFDVPFDTGSDQFRPVVLLAEDGGTIASGLYIGTSGVSGMVDLIGRLNVAYWRDDDHILFRAYDYDRAANTLTPQAAFLQVDDAGQANHPVLAVSPADNSITIAWVSEADSPTLIRARTRASDGSWGAVEVSSTFNFPPEVAVWTSPDNGLNIDQGPSLLIDASGVRHLVYIESFNGAIGDYGRVHYVTGTASGWVDEALAFLSHDPALAINAAGELYILGHGHHRNAAADSACFSMDVMCFSKRSAGSNWSVPAPILAPTGSYSFDASPSVKWSAVGFNRPEVIEFIFFSTPYDAPTVYYARLP